MKTIYLASIASIIMAMGCNSGAPLTESNSSSVENPKGNPNGLTASISFDEMEKTLQPINEGEQLTILFTYTNTGKAPLIVTKAKGSCGCTSTEYLPKEPLQPGEKGTIRAVFDSAGKPQNNTKTITISSNDPDGDKILTFHVYVEPIPQN